MNDWLKCSERVPPNGAEVETKLDDGRGVRNITNLRRQGRLWFFPDMSMYTYYMPTHWRAISPNAKLSHGAEKTP